jgi:hypothetical protein
MADESTGIMVALNEVKKTHLRRSPQMVPLGTD